MKSFKYYERRLRIERGGCWTWLRINKRTGYGHWDGDLAHRKFFKIFKGSIEPGMTIDHLCRNRACVNPAHLEQVSYRVNILRADLNLATINARKSHCDKGHEFTPGNTYIKKSNGARQCRKCRAEASKRFYYANN